MIAYIDAHRDRFGVEPICRVLNPRGVVGFRLRASVDF